MKNIQARILLLSMSLIMLTSCGPAQSEYDEQEARIKILERQLEECKNGAQKRIAYIRDLFENKKYSEVIISSKTLLSRFPGTQEAKEAQILANKSRDHCNGEGGKS